MLKKFLLSLILTVFTALPVFACTENEIDVLDDGTQCEAAKFTLSIPFPDSGRDSFSFLMTATGEFFVDCGEYGTLSSSVGDVSGKKITRNNVDSVEYTCTYNDPSWNASTWNPPISSITIKFAGNATGYTKATGYPYNDTNTAAIMFGHKVSNAAKIKTISGSLGTIFGSVESPGTGQDSKPQFSSTFANASNLHSVPANLFSGIMGTHAGMFHQTFSNCTGLTSIPENLFASFSTGSPYMFQQTFSNCTGLTSIPDNLFNTITTGAGWMFQDTFSGCTLLTSIPGTLFSSFTTGASSMFAGTFSGCTGLTEIPETLFSSFTTGASNMFPGTFRGCTGLTEIPETLFSSFTTGASYMFSGTFSGCTGLTEIPGTLFSSFTTGASYMFQSTFSYCTGLTSIPPTLFSSFTTGASSMFDSTFSGCTSLTEIPPTLFSSFTSGATSMFYNTFSGCTNISGYIPPSTFAGLIANGSPTASNMWYNTFSNTGLVTSCPSGTVQYITGYEGTTNGTTWNGKVSCQECTDNYHVDNTGTCVLNTYTVTLNENAPDATPGTTEVTATITQAMPTPITLPTRDFYTFAGYYDTAATTGGTRYYTATGTSARTWDKTSDAELYARWTPKTYTVILDKNGGSSGTASVTATYGSAMPSISLPYRNGYTFVGYYDTNSDTGGTQYYNADGSSAHVWDKTSDATLYARWATRIYTITLDKNADDAIAGTTGVDVMYGADMPMPIVLPTRVGYEFMGYYGTFQSNPEQYYNAAGESVHKFFDTIDGGRTLKAQWRCAAEYYCPNSGPANKCPDEYPNSLSGAVAETQCYKACDSQSTNIVGATGITGNDYYNTSADTCEAASCEAGYNITDSVPYLERIFGPRYAKVAAATDSNGTAIISHTPPYSSWKYYSFVDSTLYGIDGDPMAFAIDYDDGGVLFGHGKCGANYGGTYTDANIGTGNVCFCRLDGYKPNGGTKQTLNSAYWVGTPYNYTYNCENKCAAQCTKSFFSTGTSYGPTQVMYQKLNPALATCEPAKYTVTLDANGGEIPFVAPTSYTDYSYNSSDQSYTITFDSGSATGHYVCNANSGDTYETLENESSGNCFCRLDTYNSQDVSMPWVKMSSWCGECMMDCTHQLSYLSNLSLPAQTTATTTVTYGSAMPMVTVPTRTDYNFVGYYDTNGVKYYNADGTSVKNYDKTSDITLYARWTGNTINLQWGGTNENDISNGANMCTYGGAIQAPTGASAVNPPKGKKFIGWRVKKKN